MDIVWLYAVAAGLLLVAAVLLVMAMRKRRRESSEPYVPAQRDETPEDELKSLGIMDIRPREASSKKEAAGSDDPAPADTETAPNGAPPQKPASASSENHRRETAAASSEKPRPTQTTRSRRDDVMVPLLTSLRHALGAHTVCLLRQDDMAPQYHIEALVSGTTEVQTRGSFRTNTPLLTPTRAERPVTVRHVGDGGIAAAHLGYYHARPAVREVALAPVPRPADDPATYFLVADAEAPEHLGPAHARQLLTQFARTAGALLSGATEAEDQMDDQGEAPATSVRPRREIIAEEMAKAREADVPLALALVYLNEAAVVADRGEGAVAAAERDLAAELRQIAQPCRVERFGELTYGIFYQEATDVEPWTQRIQQHLDAAGGSLEGGVSIGVALLQARHTSPNAFRTDATEALREAYESGASIILE
ncbi:MAG: hypothetical protein GVY18_13655 [Bacteroidetes bacterium]|nr:hypothetical protein [Bacteroidota bacterium]